MTEPDTFGTGSAAMYLAEFRRALPRHEAMVKAVLEAILRRHEERPDYAFVDTKLDARSGRDVGEPAEPERDFAGRDSIYGWIQGRGLEALAEHAEWIGKRPPEREEAPSRDRLEAMLRRVVERTERLRADAGGMAFLMTPHGGIVERARDGMKRVIRKRGGEPTTADLFYAKGLVRAARLLQKEERVRQGTELFRRVLAAVESERLVVDQIAFDPNNPVAPVPGRFGQVWRMIAISGCIILAQHGTSGGGGEPRARPGASPDNKLAGAQEWIEAGERLIRHIFERHVNSGRTAELHHYDFVEAVDAAGRPWSSDGRILCDPGHAVEWVGLTAKFILRQRERSGAGDGVSLRGVVEALPHVFLRAMRVGFSASGIGLHKSVDLRTGRPINSDLPWWSLPEAMRAAVALLRFELPAELAAEVAHWLVRCSDAFLGNFVNPRCHWMAYQTLRADGAISDAIPATPDLDPLYHTGLSLLDVFAWEGMLS